MQTNPFKYCPNCANTTIEFIDDKKFQCSSCGFEYYHNVACATAVVLYKENKILFGRRNQEPQKGKLDLFGGFVDPKESAEEGVIREVYEELKIEMNGKNLRYVASEPNTYLYKNVLYNTLDLFYEYELDNTDFVLETSEISEIVWVPIGELKIEDLAFDSQKRFFQKNIKKLLW